ncbi:hypothetical protein CQW23_02807 [Capsicum baccatum]|uniref:NB-ARC domain-containing protein n=1 Tax=Capsicum baccatum TaxID=33114 RepID=A0A2G2XSG7_CAPBA|nr:hypothetical protein CQW23_02807 [Capsicum baccatum]
MFGLLRLYNSEAITELVHLRYLACPFDDGLVQSICNLWNLQVLVIHDGRPRGLFMTTLSIPWEVLNMPRLRYIHTKNLWLSIPPPISQITERENHLQTLTVLMPSSCTDEVFLRIANLKKLGILLVDDSVIAKKCYCLDNLVHLTQLEKFKVEIKEGYIFLRLCTSTYLQWEDMIILRKLPNLEVLKLKDHAFHEQIWDLSDEDLEHLVLTECYYLDQIPLDFVEIQTLQLIELHKCKLSVIASAKQIQSLGYDDLVVHVNYVGE